MSRDEDRLNELRERAKRRRERRSQSAPTAAIVETLARGAAGLARAVTGTGGAVDAMVEARAAVCGGCDEAEVVLGVVRRCKQCGCSTWAKIRNKNEQCPLGKW